MNYAIPRVGEPLSRIDGADKVSGKARYAAEYFPHEMLYGWIVSSPIAKGRIIAIDDGAALAVPGVVAVLSHLNRPHLARLDISYDDMIAAPGSPFRPLYDDKIVFSQQPVALVVADTLEAARDGASALQVQYERAPHNTDFDVALAAKYVPRRKRSHFVLPQSRGDADAALATAAVRHSATYRIGTHHHNPMEMHGATVQWEGNGKITVHDKTQGAQNVQAYLASVFGFAKDDVRVLNPYVGGAFGSGLRPQYHVFLATLAAKHLERSVRVTMTRQQMFSHVHRPPALQTVSLGSDANGKLAAIINDATTATSRFEHYMEVVCNWGLMAYACANAQGKYTLAEIDTYTPGDMRAPGAATGMTLFEIAMDELAYAAGIDPLALRAINYTEKDAMDDKPFTSKALREAYALGADKFGWSGRSMAPRSMRDGAQLVGWGMATGMWDALFMKTAARARFDADGMLEVACATADIGTGTYTVMAQLAGETLGVALSNITVKLGDSELPAAPPEGGSWGAASTGAAVQAACAALGDELFEAARKLPGSPLADARREHVAFIDGYLVDRERSDARVALAEAMAATGKASIEAERSAGPGVAGMLSQMKVARNTHSAIFAEVKVDEELGVVRVTRVVIAVAAGKIINPKTARSQILGGVVMGIGMALHEDSVMDHRLGRFMNHSLGEYHIPVNADIGEIDVIFVHEDDHAVNPLGVKGLGEIGIVATAAAVANAIFHATGKRVRKLPILLSDLL